MNCRSNEERGFGQLQPHLPPRSLTALRARRELLEVLISSIPHLRTQKIRFSSGKVRDRILVSSAVVTFQLMFGTEMSFADEA